MGPFYLLLEGLNPHLKPEKPNKQDYQLYFALHADFILWNRQLLSRRWLCNGWGRGRRVTVQAAWPPPETVTTYPRLDIVTKQALLTSGRGLSQGTMVDFNTKAME